MRQIKVILKTASKQKVPDSYEETINRSFAGYGAFKDIKKGSPEILEIAAQLREMDSQFHKLDKGITEVISVNLPESRASSDPNLSARKGFHLILLGTSTGKALKQYVEQSKYTRQLKEVFRKSFVDQGHPETASVFLALMNAKGESPNKVRKAVSKIFPDAVAAQINNLLQTLSHV